MADAVRRSTKRNPMRRQRQSASPPATSSRAGLAFAARAAEGLLQLQHCRECGAISYPPRDICSSCWSEAFEWRKVGAGGEILAATTLHASMNNYFRERLPWRIGAVKLDDGPVVTVHLHGGVREAERVRIQAYTDKSGQGFLMALPARETANMADDPMLRELTYAPKHRRFLITDIRSALGQAVARAVLEAGAAKVYLGAAQLWKPLPGLNEFRQSQRAELVSLDVTDSESVTEAASLIGGRVDILMNTVQRMRTGSAISVRSVSAAQEDIEANFLGPLRLLKAFGPVMRARGADGVASAAAWVNFFSVYCLANWPVFGVSAASQAAAMSLSQSARSDFLGSGVKVINIFHGPIDDEWSQELPPPKIAPTKLAQAAINALQQGRETSVVGDVAKEIYEKWSEDPRLLERELARRSVID